MKIVTVIYHHEPEGWWAESPDALSFFAAGESREVVRQHVLAALPDVVGDELEYIDVDVGQPDGALVEADAANRVSGFSDGGWSLSGTGYSPS